MTEHMSIYVLECAQGKLYVGRTGNMKMRIAQHQAGQASIWTKTYPPTAILEQYPAIPFEEDRKVLELMNMYGVGKVRGGRFSALYFQPHQHREIYTALAAETMRCMCCFRKGHFISDCKACVRCGRMTHRTDECFALSHGVEHFQLEPQDGKERAQRIARQEAIWSATNSRRAPPAH